MATVATVASCSSCASLREEAAHLRAQDAAVREELADFTAASGEIEAALEAANAALLGERAALQSKLARIHASAVALCATCTRPSQALDAGITHAVHGLQAALDDSNAHTPQIEVERDVALAALAAADAAVSAAAHEALQLRDVISSLAFTLEESAGQSCLQVEAYNALVQGNAAARAEHDATLVTLAAVREECAALRAQLGAQEAHAGEVAALRASVGKLKSALTAAEARANKLQVSLTQATSAAAASSKRGGKATSAGKSVPLRTPSKSDVFVDDGGVDDARMSEASGTTNETSAAEVESVNTQMADAASVALRSVAGDVEAALRALRDATPSATAAPAHDSEVESRMHTALDTLHVLLAADAARVRRTSSSSATGHVDEALAPVAAPAPAIAMVVAASEPRVVRGGVPLTLEAKYEALQRENAQLLSSLFKTRNNIMVFCRVRPATSEELKYGALPHSHQVAYGVTGMMIPHDVAASAAGGGTSSGTEGEEPSVAAGEAVATPVKASGALPLAPNLVVDVLSDSELAFYDRTRRSWRAFAFDKVYAPGSTQSDVFRDVAPLAQSVVEGYNACIFAYGITGSGKTHTMQGPESDPGINLRIVAKIFELATLKRTSRAFRVRVSMLEIYNEELRDLLLPPGATPAKLEIRSSDGGSHALFASPDSRARTAAGATMMSPGSTPGVQVQSLTSVEVATADEILAVFARGTLMRATAATNIHEHSSRSHCVLKVEVEGFPIEATSTPGGDASMYSSTLGKLYLVDLAGSERVRKSAVTGARLREAQYINRSLSALGDVLEALDKKTAHVPYRNSKLTHLLQDSLGGSARTLMMATVCPGAFTADETLYSLQFASRARNIDLGPAQRTVQIKNITEQYRTLRTDHAAAEHARAALEKEVAELQRTNATLEERMTALREASAKANDASRKALTQRVESMKRELVIAQETIAEERKLRVAEAETIATLTERLKKEQHVVTTAERDKRMLEQRVAALQREVTTAKASLGDARVALQRRAAQGIVRAPPGGARGTAHRASVSSGVSNDVAAKAAAAQRVPSAASMDVDVEGEDDSHAGDTGVGASPSHAAVGHDGVDGASAPSGAAKGAIGSAASKALQMQRDRRAKREAVALAARREAEEADRKLREEMNRNAKDRVRALQASALTGTGRSPAKPSAGAAAGRARGVPVSTSVAAAAVAAARAAAAGGRTTVTSLQRTAAANSRAAADRSTGSVTAHVSGEHGNSYEYMGAAAAAATAADDDFGYSDDESAGGTFMVGILNPTDEQEARALGLLSPPAPVASAAAAADTQSAVSLHSPGTSARPTFDWDAAEDEEMLRDAAVGSAAVPSAPPAVPA